MDKHDILIVSKSDDNSIYVTTKGDIFEIAAAIKAITGGIVHHTMENRGKSDAIATASLFAEAAMKGACIESNLPIKADKLCTEVIHLNGYHAISISKEEYLQWQEENQGSEEAAIKWNSKVDSTIAEKR